MKEYRTPTREAKNGLPTHYIKFTTDGFSYYQEHIWIIDGKEKSDNVGRIQIWKELFERSIKKIKG